MAPPTIAPMLMCLDPPRGVFVPWVGEGPVEVRVRDRDCEPVCVEEGVRDVEARGMIAVIGTDTSAGAVGMVDREGSGITAVENMKFVSEEDFSNVEGAEEGRDSRGEMTPFEGEADAETGLVVTESTSSRSTVKTTNPRSVTP